jgi:hypothetical protein
MERNQFFVVRDEGEWKIKHGDEHSHSYPTQREAIDSAVEAAHEASSKGQLSPSVGSG